MPISRTAIPVCEWKSLRLPVVCIEFLYPLVQLVLLARKQSKYNCSLSQAHRGIDLYIANCSWELQIWGEVSLFIEQKCSCFLHTSQRIKFSIHEGCQGCVELGTALTPTCQKTSSGQSVLLVQGLASNSYWMRVKERVKLCLFK